MEAAGAAGAAGVGKGYLTIRLSRTNHQTQLSTEGEVGWALAFAAPSGRGRMPLPPQQGPKTAPRKARFPSDYIFNRC